MAVTGSGRYVQITGGMLKFGNGSTQYGTAYADTVTYNGSTYRGIRFNGMTYLSLTGVSEISIGSVMGFSGTIPMYSTFTNTNQTLIWDPENYWEYMKGLTRQYCNYQFLHGFLIGVSK